MLSFRWLWLAVAVAIRTDEEAAAIGTDEEDSHALKATPKGDNLIRLTKGEREEVQSMNDSENDLHTWKYVVFWVVGLAAA